MFGEGSVDVPGPGVVLIDQGTAAWLFVHVHSLNQAVRHLLGVDHGIGSAAADFRVKVIQAVPHVPEKRSFGLIDDLGIAGLDVLCKRLASVMDAPLMFLKRIL